MSAPAFFFPRTVSETVDVLDAYDGTAKLVAGGTALTLMLQQRLVAPQALVSLRDVPGLGAVAAEDGVLRIGALVTHATAARHPLVRRHAPLLADSLAVVGNAQVRSAATVGGVLAEADYASDPPAALRALDAAVGAHGPTGERRIGVGELLLGFYQTALAPAEVVTEVRVPVLPVGTGSAYLKYTSRSHEDRPCVGVAAIVRLAGDGTCADLRVAVGAACDAPLRLCDIEQQARGRRLDATTLIELADAYAERADPLSDVRGSAWYRREMVRVWVRRAVEQARLRSQEAGPDGRDWAHEHSKEGAQ
ncbi:FAD binding domain-containing protein [Pseudonocardia acidicola]|uniref:Xanthine dehydrogenase family protein subunit M n=1 Tax=Pseudonocardia acidicola TaxID=2724939 RepID=A0ABX1S6T3_9PSEU|nr:xanthine dehydrogenase family protein subunit M [Pseudonocardia acidicola]NMH96825.1 xanthine dehydrogenase family protein subunit M [Pseudonocardia acidicola]